MPTTRLPLIKVLGISASGKSTLVRGLRAAGYDARPVSQEHSRVPTLWRQFGVAKVVIYLDTSLEAQLQRRPDVTWSAAARDEEITRLADAYEYAELRIDTSQMSAAEVLSVAIHWLENAKIRRAAEPLTELPATGAAFAE